MGNIIARTSMILRAIAIIALLTLTVRAELIPAARKYAWQAGVTTGVVGGIPARTTEVEVNCSTNASTDCAAAINAAIAAIGSGQVVKIKAGRHRLDSRLINGSSHSKDNFVLRGAGRTNTLLIVNHSNSSGIDFGSNVYNYDALRTYTVGGGGAIGTTNISLLTATNGYSEPIAAGWVLSIARPTRALSTATNPVISVFGYDNLINTPIEVYSRSGTNITVTQPLPTDFTNGSTLVELTFGVSKQLIGLEDFTITTTNEVTAASAGSGLTYIVNMNGLRNSWVKNVTAQYAWNYHFAINYTVNCEMRHCKIEKVLSGGSNHAGLVCASNFGLLVEDNAWKDGLQPAIEPNNGIMGCVFAYNYITNCADGILFHNVHPMFNLLEGNMLWYVPIKFDGYFGGASHNTLYRNRLPIGTPSKRFVSYHNFVANVLGSTGQSYVYTNIGAFPPYPIFEDGRPNIGNFEFSGTTDTIPYNFPGTTYVHPNTGVTWANGSAALAAQGPTTTLSGNFSTFFNESLINNTTTLIFQSPSDTNVYYVATNNNPFYATADGTGSSLTVSSRVIVTNNARLYITGVSAYQQLQKVTIPTFLRHRNIACLESVWTLVDDPSITDTNLPASLYRSSEPSWWNSSDWPAIGPDVSGGTEVAYHQPIPAEEWLYTDGEFSGGGSTGGGTGGGTGPRLKGPLNITTRAIIRSPQ